MINAEDDVIYDERLGCTIDEAIAKLLGWMRGIKRLRYLSISELGLNPKQFPHMYRLPEPLFEFIQENRAAARTNFLKACENADFSMAAKWEAKALDWDAIADRAIRYKQAITAALSAPRPQLEIEQSLTEETGEQHITLISLDYWSRREFGEGILDQQEQEQFDRIPPILKTPRTKGVERERSIIEAIKQLGYDPKALPPRQPGKAGVKADAWKKLGNRKSLFPTRDVFDKSWELLRGADEIAEQGSPPK